MVATMKSSVAVYGLILVLLAIGIKIEAQSCACSSQAALESLCQRADKFKDGISTYLEYFVCYCICPGHDVLVHHPFGLPATKDRHHADQVRFLNDVARSLSPSKGGVVFASQGEGAHLPQDIRKELYKMKQPFLSHALQRDGRDSLKHVIFIPDHLFIRQGGFFTLTREFQGVHIPFQNREHKCFWRGPASALHTSNTNLRYRMCSLSKRMNWMDAGITQALSAEADELYTREELKKPHVSDLSWTKFQCLMDIDGAVNSANLFWKLASGSVVVKVESNWTNALIEAMRPWIHYVPVQPDLSDLQEITQYVLHDNHSRIMSNMAQHAMELSRAFSYEREVQRVARDLSAVWEEESSSPEEETEEGMGFGQKVFWSHRHISQLIERLDERPRSISTRFPTSPRLTEQAFNEEFPFFLLPMYRSSATSCFPSQRTSSMCSIWTSMPTIPFISSLLGSSALTWPSDLEAAFRSPNRTGFKSDPHCPYKPHWASAPIPERNCPNSSQVVLAFADNINCNKFALFLRSLRNSGSSCADVVVFTPWASQRPCGDVVDACGAVKFVDISPKYLYLNPYVAKPAIVLEYLNNLVVRHDEEVGCMQVLVTDLEDVYFQRNPFAHLLHSIGVEMVVGDIVYTDKGQMVTIGSSSSVASSLSTISQQLLGEDITSTFKAMPVLSPTLLLGTFGGVYKSMWVLAYLLDMIDGRTADGPLGVTDTSLFNFAYYSGLLSRVVSVRALPPHLSWAINGAHYHPMKIQKDQPYNPQTNPMLNAFEEPYLVVKGYTAYHMMTIVEDFIRDEAGLDWRFKAVAGPKMCAMDELLAKEAPERSSRI